MRAHLLYLPVGFFHKATQAVVSKSFALRHYYDFSGSNKINSSCEIKVTCVFGMCTNTVLDRYVHLCLRSKTGCRLPPIVTQDTASYAVRSKLVHPSKNTFPPSGFTAAHSTPIQVNLLSALLPRLTLQRNRRHGTQSRCLALTSSFRTSTSVSIGSAKLPAMWVPDFVWRLLWKPDTLHIKMTLTLFPGQSCRRAKRPEQLQIFLP